jgi:hypothetical protein
MSGGSNKSQGSNNATASGKGGKVQNNTNHTAGGGEKTSGSNSM